LQRSSTRCAAKTDQATYVTTFRNAGQSRTIERYDGGCDFESAEVLENLVDEIAGSRGWLDCDGDGGCSKSCYGTRECDPPYLLGQDGHRHPKPGCSLAE
jgi:hypothetical protein